MDAAVFGRLVDRYLLRLRPGRTLKGVLLEFIDADMKAEDLARVISSNAFYEELLAKFVTSSTPPKAEEQEEEEEEEEEPEEENAEEPRQEAKPAEKATGAKAPEPEDVDAPETAQARPPERPSLLRLILLLGMTGTRNFLAASRLLRATGRSPIDAVAGGTFKPADHVAYAVQAESACADHGLGHDDLAYAGGLLFDFLLALSLPDPAAAKSGAKPLPPDLVTKTWEEGLRAALVAGHLARRAPEFPSKKYAFVAALMHGYGRILAACLHPAAPAEQAKWGALPDDARAAREIQAYGFQHEELGSLAVAFFSPLKAVEKAIRYQCEPYSLRVAEPNLYKLASLISISRILSAKEKAPSGDALLAEPFLGLRARELGLKGKAIDEAVKKALEKKEKEKD